MSICTVVKEMGEDGREGCEYMCACVFVCLLRWDPINGLMDGWMTGLMDCQYVTMGVSGS